MRSGGALAPERANRPERVEFRCGGSALQHIVRGVVGVASGAAYNSILRQRAADAGYWRKLSRVLNPPYVAGNNSNGLVVGHVFCDNITAVFLRRAFYEKVISLKVMIKNVLCHVGFSKLIFPISGGVQLCTCLSKSDIF